MFLAPDVAGRQKDDQKQRDEELSVSSLQAFRQHRDHLALALTGQRSEKSWTGGGQPIDFYDLKGALEDLFEAMGIGGVRFAHTEVYKARADVQAVAHAHPPMSVAFGVAGVNILPVGNRGAIFAPKVPILGFDKQIDTPERGRMVVEALRG